MHTEACSEIMVALDINGTLLKRIHKSKKMEIGTGFHGGNLCKMLHNHVVYYRPYLRELGEFLSLNRIRYVFWSTMQRHNTLLYAKSLEDFGLTEYLKCYDESHCKTGITRGSIKAKKWLKDLKVLSDVHNISLDNCVLVDDNVLKSTEGCNFIQVKEYDPNMPDRELLQLIEKLKEFVKKRQRKGDVHAHASKSKVLYQD
eukprot:jgi/Antlo1/405/893